MDAQWKRINTIVGNDENSDFQAQVAVFYEHLRRSLALPFEVTGTEDFRWEERYVLGGSRPDEYERLKKDRPSYTDKFDLLEIDNESFSEWMMFGPEDIGAHVKRKSDGKEFWLGLAELEAVRKKSANGQLLHDYAVFFVNSR